MRMTLRLPLTAQLVVNELIIMRLKASGSVVAYAYGISRAFLAVDKQKSCLYCWEFSNRTGQRTTYLPLILTGA